MADNTLILVIVESWVISFPPSLAPYAPVIRAHPTPQRLSPNSSQRTSLSPDRLIPTTSPPLSPNAGPASYSHQPTSSRLRAKFQGRRSYSEVGYFFRGCIVFIVRSLHFFFTSLYISSPYFRYQTPQPSRELRLA